MTKLRQLWKVVRESHRQPLLGETQNPPTVGPAETAITFIGHSSFLIQTGGRSLLVDPVFATRLIVLRRQRRPGIRIHDLPPIDAVLITHAHMDHLNLPSLRAVVRAMRRKNLPPPIAIVPSGVEDLVRRSGFREVRSLKWWEFTDIEVFDNQLQSALPLRVTSTPARHWGARMFNDTHRGFGGYVIETPDAPTIYHSGDTAYFNGFAEIGRRLQPHIALLPIGAYFPDSYRTVHTSPEEALRGFLDLEASLMIPMHYNTFPLGREPAGEPLRRLLLAASHAGVTDQVRPLTEGESWVGNQTSVEAGSMAAITRYA